MLIIFSSLTFEPQSVPRLSNTFGTGSGCTNLLYKKVSALLNLTLSDIHTVSPRTFTCFRGNDLLDRALINAPAYFAMAGRKPGNELSLFRIRPEIASLAISACALVCPHYHDKQYPFAMLPAQSTLIFPTTSQLTRIHILSTHSPFDRHPLQLHLHHLRQQPRWDCSSLLAALSTLTLPFTSVAIHIALPPPQFHLPIPPLLYPR
jgi:hypothetical protein